MLRHACPIRLDRRAGQSPPHEPHSRSAACRLCRRHLRHRLAPADERRRQRNALYARLLHRRKLLSVRPPHQITTRCRSDACRIGGACPSEAASSFALAYGVLWFARIPTGVIRSFNGLGDYSYGLYSLSFPIQQTFILMDRIFTPGALLVCSFPALLGLSHAIVASRRAAGVETQSLCACVAAQLLATAPVATILAAAIEGLSAAARGPTCAASNRCGSYSRPRSSLRSPAPPDHPATDSLAQPSAQSCRCRPRS